MNRIVLRFYHALPPVLRSWLATARGYQLKCWRYGPETDRLVQDALEREHWDAQKWEAYQAERLARVLHRAATQVPYYRAAWNERRRKGDQLSWECLEHWPVLEKETVRQNPRAFLAEDCIPSRMYSGHTSGTTGTPLTLWQSRATLRAYYALHSARTLHWVGLLRSDRWGHVGGQPVAAPGVDKPPFWVWNGALNQLYLSAMHFGPARATAYIEAISRYRLRYLLGYASTLSLLAAAAGELHQNLPLAGVITDSEPLLDYQRQTIENAFHCPVHQTYGQAEIVCVASECSYKRLHLWPEVGWTEILDDADRPVAPGQPGRIVATGLLNEEMPLIRYDTRDLGQLAGQGVVCPCSRTLPVLDRVWGRMDDVIVTKDGRHIVQIDRILEPRLHIREAQIVQKGVGQFVVRVVPAKGWCKRDETRLKESLLALVGQAHVTVELVSTIPRTWAGKFRVIVSEMNPQRDVSPAGQPSFCEE